MIEVAARLGGGHDAELVEAATGVDLNDLAIDAALGRAGRRARSPSRASAAPSRASWSPPPGVLESVEVPDDLEGVERVRIYREPGHVFAPLRRGADRAGAVLALGDSRERGRRAGERRGRAHTLHHRRCRRLSV